MKKTKSSEKIKVEVRGKRPKRIQTSIEKMCKSDTLIDKTMPRMKY